MFESLFIWHWALRSSLICRAVLAAVDEGRKSSQGLAREITLQVMPWVCMKMNLDLKEEYVLSTGRPRESRGLEGSSSESRMIRRGGREVSEGWWMYGTVVRDERREM